MLRVWGAYNYLERLIHGGAYFGILQYLMVHVHDLHFNTISFSS